MLMKGRLTLPTDADVIDETIRLKNLLGADALRDCDGTVMPDALLSEPVKKYATYYTTRKDNEWASQNPDEIQQEYLISNRVTARGESLRIRLMEGFHTEQLKVNTLDDPKRWWEVIDRTTGEVVPIDQWEFDEAFAAVANSHRRLTLSVTANITFLRPAKSGYVYADAAEVFNHHRIPFVEVKITNEKGELIAIFTSSGYRKETELPVEDLE